MEKMIFLEMKSELKTQEQNGLIGEKWERF